MVFYLLMAICLTVSTPAGPYNHTKFISFSYLLSLFITFSVLVYSFPIIFHLHLLYSSSLFGSIINHIILVHLLDIPLQEPVNPLPASPFILMLFLWFFWMVCTWRGLQMTLLIYCFLHLRSKSGGLVDECTRSLIY